MEQPAPISELGEGKGLISRAIETYGKAKKMIGKAPETTAECNLGF